MTTLKLTIFKAKVLKDGRHKIGTTDASSSTNQYQKYQRISPKTLKRTIPLYSPSFSSTLLRLGRPPLIALIVTPTPQGLLSIYSPPTVVYTPTPVEL